MINNLNFAAQALRVLMCISLVLLTGCSSKMGKKIKDCYLGYYNILPGEFPQGYRVVDETFVQDHVRSKKIYDEFSTIAFFDALMFDESVLNFMVDLKAQKRAMSKSDRDMELMRQLEDLNRWHSFYVLADIRGRDHTGLTDEKPLWSLSFEYEPGKRCAPEEITEVELDPEVASMFGKEIEENMVSKTAYLVRFPRIKPEPGQEESSTKSLIFSSVTLEARVSWDK